MPIGSKGFFRFTIHQSGFKFAFVRTASALISSRKTRNSTFCDQKWCSTHPTGDEKEVFHLHNVCNVLHNVCNVLQCTCLTVDIACLLLHKCNIIACLLVTVYFASFFCKPPPLVSTLACLLFLDAWLFSNMSSMWTLCSVVVYFASLCLPLACLLL